MTTISATNIHIETDNIPAEADGLYLLLPRRGSYMVRALEMRFPMEMHLKETAFGKEKMRAEEGKRIPCNTVLGSFKKNKQP